MSPKSAFTKAYFEAALWSSTDDDGEPLDKNYTIADISQECAEQMALDCAQFQIENCADIETVTYTQAGHDFWLTRNGHGAGFWDGDWPEEVGDRLTKAAREFGEFSLHVGDDGLIYA
jgi:hypothetical protein